MNHFSKKTYFLGFLLLLLSAPLCAEHNTVIATMNAGVNPAGIAITHDNHKAYVANNNNYDIADQDSVTVLDLKHNTVITTIHDDSFDAPFTVTLGRKDKRAYVTNSNGTTISIIDTKTNSVIGTIDGFDGPSAMVILPKCNFSLAYVANYGAEDGVGSGSGNTLNVVNLDTNAIVGNPITVNQAPAALAVSPDGRYVYVISYVDGQEGTGTLQVIDTRTNMVIDTVTGFFGPFDIAISPNGRTAYVTNFGSNDFAPFGSTVSVVNLKCQPSIITTIELNSIQPSGIAVAPNGDFVYVTNYNTLYAGEDFTDLTPGQGTVNIIDAHRKEVVPPTIVVGESPSAIAIAPNGRHAYVTNYTSNTVDVIALRH